MASNYAAGAAASANNWSSASAAGAIYAISEASAYSAMHIENRNFEATILSPIWNGREPAWVADCWEGLKSLILKNHDCWTFWIDWYEGLLEGRTPDWELWRKVALIDDAIWQEGPEAVAVAIEDIKRKLAPPSLPPEVVTAQAKRLIAKPKTTKLIANDAAAKIEAAISDYMTVADANALPDGLERLHNLPAILRAMAATSQTEERIAKLEAQIVQLVGETLGLARDVRMLKLASKKGHHWRGLAWSSPRKKRQQF